MLDLPLTPFALAISPVVAVTFACLIFFKRDPVSQPSVVAAIPFGLSSIALLLAQSAVSLLSTFQQIATDRTTLLAAVVSGLLKAQRPLAWGLVDLGACLAVLMFVSLFLRYSRDEETAPIHAYISLPALIITGATLVLGFVMVYVEYGTVDLVMMIVDNHRYQALASQYGTVSPAYFASHISSRFVATTFLSSALFFVLIVAGALDLLWRQKQNARPAFASVLTLGTVIGCGIGALSEFGFVDYLLHLH